MGAAISSQSDLAKNDHLNRLVSKEVLSPSDPFWNSLLSFNFMQPRSKTEWKTFELSIEELQKRFLISNLKTGNFVSLVKVILLRHAELKDSVLSENSLFIWQTSNALFILRIVLKFMVERIKEEDVVRQFNVTAEEDGGDCLLTTFIAILQELLVETPLETQSYYLHVEATRVLVVLLSSVLYSQGKPSHQLTAWREMMRSNLTIPLTCSLLQRYIDQSSPPPLQDSQGSIVLGLASSVWSIITLGYGTAETGEETEKTLADISLSLILLLTNHCTDTSAFKNPYREALFSFSNASEKVLDTGAAFRLEYPPLYTTLAKTLHTEDATLLLYLLLHRNNKFRNFVLAGSDTEQLVIPILQTLYTCTVNCSNQANNHHIYMSLIILLIASEEELFNQTVHGSLLKPQQVVWYTERTVTQLSLGGLLILVVIRTIQYNMLKMRDKYLHTNCLAALANMSSQFKSLHPYVAQRIVSLFETLARKHARLVDGLETVADEVQEEGFDEVSEAVQDAAVLEEVLRMVLEIINSCLVHQTQHNPNLIYTILYKKELFEVAAKNPAFQDLMGNINIVLVYISSRLEQVTERRGGSLSVEEVQEVVRQGATQFPRDRLTKLPDLKFKYVEEDKPEDFFIPYVWSLAQTKMYWNPQHIKLFSS